MARAMLDYFPAALAAVAECSKKSNDFHNPGEEIHWARDKSNDHADCIIRHLVDRGSVDSDGIRHSVKVAWRALALLQEELEAEGAEVSRASRFTTERSEVPHQLNFWYPWAPYRLNPGDDFPVNYDSAVVVRKRAASGKGFIEEAGDAGDFYWAEGTTILSYKVLKHGKG